MARKSNQTTKNKSGKLARLLRSPKHLILLAFILGFAGVGAYKVYQSSAASANKSATTVEGCMNSGVVLKTGSSGSCVTTLQRVLNGVNQLSNTNWNNLALDGKFGNQTGWAVLAFQSYAGLKVDAIVGPQTWKSLDGLCSNSTVKPYCGFSSSNLR